eukprot:gb/GECH01008543.1/.p1 GENE.gb/GECH01008543.1/~~gb/GECH01008543.1/.p1  ORF type:complete len:902 (+),score=194.95 gb/GECH01008543.1/:1-2706(+)
MSDENVVVAVRVRPFNTREKKRDARLILRMEGPNTWITDPETEEEDLFTFDYSLWSHDVESEHYVNQDTLFQELGEKILSNSLKGYNACMFAYGQTGSGKSYSMLGTDEDPGIIPRYCSRVFENIDNEKDENTRFQVKISYLEIYNESIKDLLNPETSASKLRVREHPKTGIFVSNLEKVGVSSYQDIEEFMDEGNKSRSVASTHMNSESSRSHAVFAIYLDQIRTDPESKKEFKKSSQVNLIDLAGSERQKSAGTRGKRFREGVAINKSLSMLGNVISALAKGDQQFVPYRNSVLTHLLRDSLGGNSYTMMVAALSPAHMNYDETLSTLRYADRAKKIVNKVKVNEDPAAKQIRELKEEVAELKKQLEGEEPNEEGEWNEEEIKEKLKDDEEFLKEILTPWEEKIEEAKKLKTERKHALEDMGLDMGEISKAFGVDHDIYFQSVSADPMMSGHVLFAMKKDSIKVGSDPGCDVVLKGVGITSHVCTLEKNEENQVVMKPTPDSKCTVNGQIVKEEKLIPSLGMVMFGMTHVFRIVYPGDDPQSQPVSDLYWQARQEMMQNNEKVLELIRHYMNLSGKDHEKTEEDEELTELFVEIVSEIDEANAISEEMGKSKYFTLDITAPAKMDDPSCVPRIIVRVNNENHEEEEDLWSVPYFRSKLEEMEDMHQSWIQSGNPEDYSVPKHQDPFHIFDVDEYQELVEENQKMKGKLVSSGDGKQQEKINEANQQIAMLTNQLQHSNKHIDSLQEQVIELRDSQADTDKRLEQQNEKIYRKSERIASLETTLEEKEKLNKMFKNEVEEKEQHLEHLKQKLNDLRQGRYEGEQELDEKSEEIERLELQMERTNQEVVTLNSTLKSCREENRELRQEKSDLENELHQVKKINQSIKQQNEPQSSKCCTIS